jgi:hypothetical protein
MADKDYKMKKYFIIFGFASALFLETTGWAITIDNQCPTTTSHGTNFHFINQDTADPKCSTFWKDLRAGVATFPLGDCTYIMEAEGVVGSTTIVSGRGDGNTKRVLCDRSGMLWTCACRVTN